MELSSNPKRVKENLLKFTVKDKETDSAGYK